MNAHVQLNPECWLPTASFYGELKSYTHPARDTRRAETFVTASLDCNTCQMLSLKVPVTPRCICCQWLYDRGSPFSHICSRFTHLDQRGCVILCRDTISAALSAERPSVSKSPSVAAVVQAFEWLGPRQIKTLRLCFFLLPVVINLRCVL